jgi:DNA-binding NarL/FixJ family response regulator
VPEHVRILIAERQPIFREGLRTLLETDTSLLIVGNTGDDGPGLIDLVRELNPDILLLGVPRTGAATTDRLQELAANGSHVRTIVMTARIESPDVIKALHLGARGAIPKDSNPEQLFNSIHSVMGGHFWADGESVPTNSDGLRRVKLSRRRGGTFGLTRRELEIVGGVIGGLSNREIAHRSLISENTVKRHLAHIFDKLGASNRLELAIFASHHRLLDGM